jgi:hypothetical protein
MLLFIHNKKEVAQMKIPRRPKAEKGKYEGKQFLDYKEAGDYLGIRHTALYHYVTEMEIETHKFKRNRKRYLAFTDVKRIEQAMESPWLAGPEKAVA